MSSSNSASAIQNLKKEMNERNNNQVINSYELMIAKDMLNAVNDETFFSLPLKNIFNIVSKVDFSEFQDPVQLIKSIITQIIHAHPGENETILLLPLFKTNNLDLSLDSCVQLLSPFSYCDIFVQLHQKFEDQNHEVEVDVEYQLTQLLNNLVKSYTKKMKQSFRAFKVRNNEDLQDYEVDIFDAVKHGDLQKMCDLIENGADIEEKDIDQRTLLHYACFWGKIEIVRYLVENGADIESKDIDQATPLYHACSVGNLPIVQYLIEKGANIEAKTQKESTPLHIACSVGNLQVVQYLIE